MSHHLLLGAGFSRNWDGWLATEVFEYLLGHPEIAENEVLRRALWEAQSNGGFEHALEIFQAISQRGDADGAKNLASLESAVVAMFEEMNQGFDRILDWEFSKQINHQITTFLANFEMIFTLNQDLLVERHYLAAEPSLRRKDSWDGAAMPGLSSVGTPPASLAGKRWQILGEETFKIENRIQPFFKLHGSTNWDSPDGTKALVVGGHKARAIGGIPLLKWYFEQFEQALLTDDARLMVIGYGFRDQHINNVLINGINENGLKIFVVSPDGANQARKVNHSVGGAIFAKEPLDEAFELGLIGASQRGLREIFGGNGLELAKLQRFLSS